MQRILLVMLCFMTFTVSSYAQAPSSAVFLIERAVDLLSRYYAGFATFNITELEKIAKDKLSSICKDSQACDYKQGIPVLDELISSLGDGHTFRMSALRRAEFNANAANQPMLGVGMKYAALPDAPALVVTRVLENSPTALAGIKRGDVIFGVNGNLNRFKSAAEAIVAISELEATVPSIQFEFRDSRTVILEPRRIGPWLPSLEIKNDIAIITFYQFLTPVVAARVQEYIRDSTNVKAIILDVRGSGGGSAFESIGSAGGFIEPVGTTFESKNGKGGYEFQNGVIKSNGFAVWNLNPFTRFDKNKPVLVLTNRISRSAAEYMTYFLQRLGRAKVLGERTAGVLNTSTGLYDLPDGSTFAITAARSSSLDGVPHPEFVTPDFEMLDDMSALSRGKDLILEKAFEMLR
jgi:carboxyl-terminal processing protease